MAIDESILSGVFDILSMTEDERNEIYWAVCELVKNRLDKARSV